MFFLLYTAGPDSTLDTLSFGPNITSIISADGKFFTCGKGHLGRDGPGDTLLPVNIPGHFAGTTSPYWTAGVTRGGTVYMFGPNSERFGRQGPADVPLPVAIRDICSITGTPWSMSLITQRGKLYTCGSKPYLLGRDGPTDVPRLVDMPGEVSLVSFGEFHVAVVNKNGSLFTYGGNDPAFKDLLGRDGDGKVPGQVDIPGKIVSVSANQHHTAAVTECGRLFTFGNKYAVSNGFLGEIGPARTPLEVIVPNQKFIRTVAAHSHTLALASSGLLFTFGDNEALREGRLGRQESANRALPISIPSTVVDFAANSFTAGAVTKDGKLYTWGFEPHLLGRVGPSNLPIEVIIPGRVIAVSVGVDQMGAVTDEGKLFVWGENNDGRLGLGHTRTVPLPTEVLGIRVKVPQINDIGIIQKRDILMFSKILITAGLLRVLSVPYYGFIIDGWELV